MRVWAIGCVHWLLPGLDCRFVFLTLQRAGLWGLGLPRVNAEWGFAMRWACFALRRALAVKFALGGVLDWVIGFGLGCCQGGAALLTELSAGRFCAEVFRVSVLVRQCEIPQAGESISYLSLNLRGMPRSLAKCNANLYGPCGK